VLHDVTGKKWTGGLLGQGLKLKFPSPHKALNTEENGTFVKVLGTLTMALSSCGQLHYYATFVKEGVLGPNKF
jgi:hypothetical protein